MEESIVEGKIPTNRQTPTVSIIVITFNHEKYIAKTIESIMIQETDFLFELVIANDASTDSTNAIIENCIKKHSKGNLIRYIHREKNVGMIANFISALNQCTGKYIAMCEGDDFWTDTYKLQKQVGFLEANDDFTICFHKILILTDGHLQEDYITRVPGETTGQTELLRTNYIHTVSAVFRNILGNLPAWFNSAMPGDYPLWMLLTNNGGKIKYINETMAVYRVHNNSVWSMQDGNNKYEQPIAITFLNCGRELNIRDQQYLEWHILSLARSVGKKGYQHLTRAAYLSFVSWALRRTKLNRQQWFDVLGPLFKK